MMSSTHETLVVEVWFEVEKDADGYPKSRDQEALLCKPLNADCTLCVAASVPFYLRNVAYGDTISTEQDPSGSLRFKEIMKRGGYSIYRILLHDTAKKDQLIAKLLDFGVLLERDGNLIAFAVPPTANSDAIVDYILAGKKKGIWGAQDGYIFES
jgi:Domain of unknown function (DUF4265)